MVTNPDIRVGTGPLTVTYSLIANNAGTTLVEAPVGSPDANGNLVGGSINGVIDLQYTSIPLEDPNVYVLKPTSPAINAGDPSFDADEFEPPLSTDYRGGPFARVSGGRIDMGAIESGQSVTLVVDTLEFEDDLDYSQGHLSLLEAVRLSSQNPGLDTISFDADLFAEGSQIIVGEGTPLFLADSTVIAGPGRDLLTFVGNGLSSKATVEIRDMALEGGPVTAVDLHILENVAIRGGLVGADNVVMQNCVVEDSPSFGVSAKYSIEVVDSEIRGNAGHEILSIVVDEEYFQAAASWDLTPSVN